MRKRDAAVSRHQRRGTPPPEAGAPGQPSATWDAQHTLFLVSTPIGNLEDITLRAMRVLREVTLIAAEDTRHTARLLAKYDITTPLLSYHEHNKLARLDRVFAALDEGDVALVSDAGTPGLSDPGYELVREALARGVRVTPVPGASALLAAVVASGLVPGPFTFSGFPPRASGERRAAFARLARSPTPTVLYEAPHRLLATLRDLHAACGERPVAIARELTKLHEEIRREPLSAAIAHFTATPPRGEFAIVLAGAPATTDAVPESDVEATLQRLLDAGLAPATAAKEVARLTGRPRAELYALALRIKERDSAPRTIPDG